jgi:hypothetical protein
MVLWSYIDSGGGHMTTTQILAHLIGDYWLQSGWMANGKTKNIWVASVHALTYSLPIVLLCHPSLSAWLVIVTTHVLIDRWRLSALSAQTALASQHS